MFTFLKRLFEKKSSTDRERQPAAQVSPQTTVTESEPEYQRPLQLCVMGKGSMVNYQPGGMYACDCVWWVSEETREDGQPVYIRENAEQMVKVPEGQSFTAAGKLYRNLSQLGPNDVIDGMDTDIHGRQVLCYRERFPCFDSYDYLHEHRFHRWYFILEKGKLTRIYTADESGWIHITEDVENAERKCVALMKQHGWIQ